MTRHVYTADTVNVINSGIATGNIVVSDGGTVANALSALSGASVSCITPQNASNNTTTFEFTASGLPAINTARKQGRWLRCTVQITSGDPNLPANSCALTFKCGSTNIQVATTNVTAFSYPKTFYFQYPINGSNGGTDYWQGDPAQVKFVMSGMRTTLGAGGQSDIAVSYVKFEYGEADDFMDVDTTAAANRDAGLGGIAWTNPNNSIGNDTNGASYQQASASYSLDRTKGASFTLPAGTTYQGMEVWDGMTMSNSLSRVIMGLAHWPLSSPASNTPTYQFDIDYGAGDSWDTINPITSTSPAGSGLKTSNSYMVWGGGPGDTFQDPGFGVIQNSFPALTESRLLSGGYAPTLIVSMTNATNAFLANRVFFRVFYDNPPVVGAPLLLCEA